MIIMVNGQWSLVIVIIEHHVEQSQEDGHKKYDLNFNLGSGKQLQEVSFASFDIDEENNDAGW